MRRMIFIFLVGCFVGFTMNYLLYVSNNKKSKLQQLQSIHLTKRLHIENCTIAYNNDGWLGVWRKNENIPGLVFYAELKCERDGRIDFLEK